MGALGRLSAAFHPLLNAAGFQGGTGFDRVESQTHILLIWNDLFVRASGYPPGSKSL
jgi:hypothetical protein